MFVSERDTLLRSKMRYLEVRAQQSWSIGEHEAQVSAALEWEVMKAEVLGRVTTVMFGGVSL